METNKTPRSIGKKVKIGIRPVIDGRRGGVRESLEGQVMTMAKQTALFLEKELKHPDGKKVECVIADTCIGGVAEAAACADKFREHNVGVSLSVTPCWAYGSETIDMDPLTPKAIWGFNGTERPGAVYLAAALAGHGQKGLPAFGIYGKDVQDADDKNIPDDVQEKLLRFSKAGLAMASMKGKSYLSIGSVSMGIAGSEVNPDFLENYLGMRSENIDMTEIKRRIDNGIYDPQEFKRALEWVRQNCSEGKDYNAAKSRKSREQKDQDWKFVVKMTLIVRDLMAGNPVLNNLGFKEEALGHNAIAAGFQGQRQWTDHYPNGDFTEAILCSSFDWNGLRQPYLLATENDFLNGISMLFGHMLTGSAQVFSDVRTYWSPDAVKRVTGHTLSGHAVNGFIHLINSGSSALDGSGQQSIDGRPAIKPWWKITNEEIDACLKNTKWSSAILEYFRGGGFSSTFSTRGEMPVTLTRINIIKGLGPVLQLAEGYTINLPDTVAEILNERTNPTWPTTWFVPNLTGKAPFSDVYQVMANWGANHGAFSYGHIGA